MTICNMTIEGGARAGMVAPDDTTFAYLEGRPGAPKGAAWEQALDAGGRSAPTRARRSTARSRSTSPSSSRRSPGARTPAWSRRSRARVPDPASYDDPTERRAVELALGYMGLEPGTPLARDPGRPRLHRLLHELADRGSARRRGGRLRPPGRELASGRWSCPGSAKVKRQAEDEGLDRVFTSAGFEWREAGCSMCLGMNPDILAAGERCASTSNRNFEGRQGAGGRTHLVSPQMAAAAAITGHFTDVRELG